MWPSFDEFKTWFMATGMAPAVPVSAESALVSAKKRWERETGFTPFVAADAESSVWLTPADFGDVLGFAGGFVTVTAVGVAAQPQGETTDKTEFTDYVLERETAGGPYTQLRWLRGAFGTVPRSGWTSGLHQTVLVTGRRGYCTKGSDEAKDAQEAVFQLAASILDPSVSISDGPLKKVTQGPVTLEYDTQNGLDRAGSFLKFFETKVSEYRRIVI